ncbi:MAG: hypothetical protein HXX13_06905 [Bacteroidetes bacterium]|nr:hypothetical protein [Bacteroidota bacterium]
MKKRLFLIVSLTIICLHSFSQETNVKMILSDSNSSCSEIQYACMQLIPLYYQDGIIDTASILLDFWEKHCGLDETIYRTKALWAIDAGTFTDTLVTNSMIGYLDLYQWLSQDTSGRCLKEYNYYTPEFELLKWYKTFTDSIASRALSYSDLSAEERFFATFYLHPADSLYEGLLKEPLSFTKLGKTYQQNVGGELSEWLQNWGETLGAWIPYDKLNTIGPHPSVGVFIAVRNKKMIYSGAASLRFFRSWNDFQVMYKDSLYTTHNFMGLNFMLETGRQLIDWRRHELDLLGGIDLELMDVLNLKNDPATADDNESKYLASPAIHFGLGYRYYTKSDHFFGISSRYHLMNFNNKQGSNLRGNALTINLEYGFGENRWLHEKNTYLNQRLPLK